MALIINTNIKNDAGGYLVDADAVKVAEGEMLPAALAGKQDIAPIKTVMDAPASANTQFFLGIISTALAIAFPATGALGDMIYISYTTLANPPVVTVSTEHTIGLDDFDANLASSAYELIGLWTGSVWSVATRVVDAP